MVADTTTITVEPAIKSFTISASPTNLHIHGDTDSIRTLTAKIVYYDGNSQVVTHDKDMTFSYSYEDNNTLSYTAKTKDNTIEIIGRGTGLGRSLSVYGTYSLEKYGTFTRTLAFDVTAPVKVIAAVKILNAPAAIEYGQHYAYLRNIITFEDGTTTANLGQWSSSNPSIISVSSNGQIAAHSSHGTATITFSSSRDNKSDSVVVQAIPTMTTLAFAKDNYQVIINESVFMPADALVAGYSDGAMEAVLQNVTFSFFNNKIVASTKPASNGVTIDAGSQIGKTLLTARIHKGNKILYADTQFSVQEDIHAPKINISIDNGRPTTTLESINYTISASEASYVSHVFVSTTDDTPAVSETGWQEVTSSGTLLMGVRHFSVAGTTEYVARTLYAWGKNDEKRHHLTRSVSQHSANRASRNTFSGWWRKSTCLPAVVSR